ncbi:MAG TPA: copper homeostasis membrane protein CopD [Usitatibacter sp.]|nr:copper homeostasis membrane protein CopD [Usitatibacter sp.]
MEPLLPIVRGVHFAAVIALFGQLAFACFLAPGRIPPPRFMAVAGSGVGLAAASAIAWLALEAQSMSGLPLREALALDTLRAVLTQTAFGELWLARIVILFVAAAALPALRERVGRTPRWALPVAFAASALVLASLAGTGHAAAGQGAELMARLLADALHVLAAGAWLGTLPPLVMVTGDAVRRGDAEAFRVAREATERFSTLGVASVGTLVLSGFANASYTLHGIAGLFTPGYGAMLTAKLMLFAFMISFAAVNRMWLTPRLAMRPREQVRASLRALRRNASAELLLGLAILGLVAQLGITMPPDPHMAKRHAPDASPPAGVSLRS